MKRHLLLSGQLRLTLFIIISQLFIQSGYAQSWVWAANGSGADDDRGYGVDIDVQGNTFVTGFFTDTMHFGNTVLIGNGYHDIFVAKFDPDGHLIWAKKAGGKYPDEGNSIKADKLGNCYVTGSFNGQATFGEGSDEVILKSNGPSADIFIAKYNKNGLLLWALQAGGSDTEDAKSLSINDAGDVYITGYFGESATFGSGSTTGTIKNTGGLFDQDMFIAKYDVNGNFYWVRQAGGPYSDVGSSVGNDNSGNIYVSGYFEGTASFDGVTISGSGATDVFIAKYDNNGNILWAQSAGGTGFDGEAGCSIKADLNGNCYLTGNFSETAVFGKGGQSKSLSSSGFYDIFVTKFDKQGNLLWAQKAGGARTEMGTDISVDALGNAFVTGNFTGDVSFANNSLHGEGQDIFVTKYDSQGNNLWARSAGGKGNDYGAGIGIDKFGNSHVTGLFESKVTFKGDSASTELSCEGFYDIFVAEISGEGIVLASNEISTGATVVYPNPVTDILHIEINLTGAQKVDITLVNLMGATVFKTEEQMERGYFKHVDMSSFPAGIYFCTISNKQEERTFKLVKQ